MIIEQNRIEQNGSERCRLVKAVLFCFSSPERQKWMHWVAWSKTLESHCTDEQNLSQRLNHSSSAHPPPANPSPPLQPSPRGPAPSSQQVCAQASTWCQTLLKGPPSPACSCPLLQPCHSGAAGGSRVSDASSRWGCSLGMGAAGPLWVFLALAVPGVLGELGMGARRQGRVWGRDGLCAAMQRRQSKVRRRGSLACLARFGGPRDLLVLNILARSSWAGTTRIAGCIRDALCDLPSVACGVACPLCALRAPRPRDSACAQRSGSGGLRALTPGHISETYSC